jgi:hypothetical protein
VDWAQGDGTKGGRSARYTGGWVQKRAVSAPALRRGEDPDESSSALELSLDTADEARLFWGKTWCACAQPAGSTLGFWNRVC